MGRKHCGKRINCSLRAISPFPTLFSKGVYCRHVKTRAYFGCSVRVNSYSHVCCFPHFLIIYPYKVMRNPTHFVDNFKKNLDPTNSQNLSFISYIYECIDLYTILYMYCEYLKVSQRPCFQVTEVR